MYALLNNKNFNQGRIICLDNPYIIGQVMTFRTDEDVANSQIAKPEQWQVGGKINGYRIYILMLNSLEPYDTTTHGSAQFLARIMREMADFYWNEKMKNGNNRYYDKYKE